MLGVVGIIVQSFIRLGGPYYDEPNFLLAPAKVPAEAWAQIFAAIGAVEFFTNKGKMTMDEMFEDSSREPGNLGFDPMGFSKKEADREKLQTNEIKNGRLAMLAFSGLITQAALTDGGFPYIANY